jgi:hypothetical protein
MKQKKNFLQKSYQQAKSFGKEYVLNKTKSIFKNWVALLQGELKNQKSFVKNQKRIVVPRKLSFEKPQKLVTNRPYNRIFT